jgi:hypothetical protein
LLQCVTVKPLAGATCEPSNGGGERDCRPQAQCAPYGVRGGEDTVPSIHVRENGLFDVMAALLDGYCVDDPSVGEYCDLAAVYAVPAGIDQLAGRLGPMADRSGV